MKKLASLKMSKPLQFRARATAKGHIDKWENGVLHGWAHLPAEPGKRISVRVTVNGVVASEGVADRYREDLQQNSIGDGKYGFAIATPISLLDDSGAAVHIVDASSGQRIHTNEYSVTKQNPSRVHLSGVESDHLVGWISTPMDAAQPLRLYMLADGALVGNGSPQAGGDAVNFRIALPRDLFDGMPHLLTVGIEGMPGSEASWLDVLSPIQTPWSYLASSVDRNGYLALPRTAGYRYESIRNHLAVLTHGAVTDVARLRQISAAHAAVVEGYESRRRFPALHLVEETEPTVSIVIPVHNKVELTYHCLASLILAYNKSSFEVIVVDDCSSDKTRDLTSIVENVRLLRNPSNLGFLRSCNKGAAEARGKYIVFLNNDTEVTSGWLDELVETFTRFHGVGLAGSKLLYPDGSLQEAGGIVWGNGEPWNLGRGSNPKHPSFSYARQTDYLSGASLMITRDVWTDVGGFSEEFAPAYYEDTDLAFKVRAAGYKTMYCPFSEVIHFEGMSNGRDVSSGIKKHQVANEPKFRAKWFSDYKGNGTVGDRVSLNADRGIVHRVLMIDYTTPRPDHDAGSYAAVQEIKLLQANGCKVTFVGENLAHLGKYTDDLQRLGVECLYAPFYTSISEVLEQRGSEFDLVYITRFDVAERSIAHIRKHTRAKVLFNNADLHFLRELRSALSAGKTDLSGPLATRDRELTLMRKVDAVLSYTKTEHAVIVSHNLRSDNLFLCPWVLEPQRATSSFDGRKGIAFLGGFRHQPNVEAVIYFIECVMPRLRAANAGITFNIYGSSVPDEILEMQTEDVIVHGFVENLDDVFGQCRVFVAPLQSGAGIKGKVLESIAYQVPSVLSSVAAEGTGLVHGVNTLIADTPEDWEKAILELYFDQQCWTSKASQLETLRAAHYSFASGVTAMSLPLQYLGLYQPSRRATHRPLQRETGFGHANFRTRHGAL